MNESDLLQYFGYFVVAWVIGYSISLKILIFRKFADEVSS